MASAMREGGLLAWQRRGYSRNHRDRVNLLIHMVAVPGFIAGTLAALMQALNGRWFGVSIALIVAVVSFAVQGMGHKREPVAPEAFTGAGDFVASMFAEQFVTFPHFVLTGQWARNLAGRDNQR